MKEDNFSINLGEDEFIIVVDALVNLFEKFKGDKGYRHEIAVLLGKVMDTRRMGNEQTGELEDEDELEL